MSDISMCKNETCKVRDQCYRFTADPAQAGQSYGDFAPSDDKACPECCYFWPIKEDKGWR